MELKRKPLGVEAKAKAKGTSESPSAATENLPAVKGENESDQLRPERDEADLENVLSDAQSDNAQPNEGEVSGRVWFARIKRFGVPVLGLLLVAGASFLIIKFKPYAMFSTNAAPRLDPVTSIMRPIPMPDYRDTLDFLLAYEIGGTNMFIAIRMEVGFQNPTRYQNFKDQSVAFRDTVYSFLLLQNSSGNTVKSWHSVIEKDLLDYLRVTLPQSCADTIRLAQVENL
jgi:hypothetical protein